MSSPTRSKNSKHCHPSGAERCAFFAQRSAKSKDPLQVCGEMDPAREFTRQCDAPQVPGWKLPDGPVLGFSDTGSFDCGWSSRWGAKISPRSGSQEFL